MEYNEESYTKLLHINDSLQSQNAKLRQQITLHTVEPSSIREEKAWDVGYLIGTRDGTGEGWAEEGFSIDNPFTVARKLAEGKKKHA